MKDFEFHTPTNLQEVYRLLDQYGDEARVISGGTGLVNMMKQDLIASDHLVSMQKVPNLKYIRWTNEGLQVGGLTTQQEMATSREVHQRFPLLTETYGEVATVRVRNMATVGGGVAHGDPAQDPPVALLVLDAKVVLSSKNGQRVASIRDGFLVDYYTTDVQPGEVVTGIVVPPTPQGAKTTFLKFLPRTADDYATVSVAALGVVEGGQVRDVRLALGAVGTTAIYSKNAPKALIGKRPTEALIKQAAEAVASEVSPNTDFRGSAEYKTDMAVVFARRALSKVLGVS
jgi:carbon-monoxide dehydrogenase medium subunit